MPRIFFLPLTKISISFFVSVILGVIVVLIESTIDNILEREEIHRNLHTQIERTIHAYTVTHKDASAEKVAQFVARYVQQVLPDEVITVPPTSDNPSEIDIKPIWSLTEGSGNLQLFINPKYLSVETTGADSREILDGILASLLIFM